MLSTFPGAVLPRHPFSAFPFPSLPSLFPCPVMHYDSLPFPSLPSSFFLVLPLPFFSFPLPSLALPCHALQFPSLSLTSLLFRSCPTVPCLTLLYLAVAYSQAKGEEKTRPAKSVYHARKRKISLLFALTQKEAEQEYKRRENWSGLLWSEDDKDPEFRTKADFRDCTSIRKKKGA